MNYLLDTCILIWWLENSLDKKLTKIINSPNNHIFISSATVWEIIIKEKTGKLKTPGDLKEQLILNNFIELPINHQHSFNLNNLPEIHKDPFDRILISQAQIENLTLITHDHYIKQYPIKTI